MSKKVIELIRVSTEGQAAADKASIPAQRAANRRTSAAYGLEICKSFEISDVSGAAVLHAPEIREMIELMRSPEIHGVVTKEFSRLMRPENFDDYQLLQHFADTKTILYLPEGPIDLGSKMGRLMGGVRALFAGVEREEIRERVWGAKEAKRRQGENPQSYITLPYGVGYKKDLGWFYTPSSEKVREAFRLLLAGDIGYNEIAKRTGITPTGLRIMLRNPIYTGWRVIDKKRDTSPSASKHKRDGRQGDRPKIQRAPDEIIRVKVIDVGLVSEADFQQAQHIMDVKKKRHWRTSPDHVSPYAYHGHLSCADCGEIVYTYSNARGGKYYVCKAKQYPKSTDHKCTTSYMRRELLEPQLDVIFGDRLTDPAFLRALVQEHERRMEDPVSFGVLTRIEAEISNLAAKRERVLGAYFDGVIAGPDRDGRLAGIDAELKVNQGLLAQHTPVAPMATEVLESICSTFHDWEFLNTQDKRRILAATAADIRVANSSIHGVYINLPEPRSMEVTRTGIHALPFCHVELRAAKPKHERYPNEINTLGDHLRRRRLDQNLLQNQVAEQIGVDVTTVCNWEGNASTPAIRYVPAILEFLGYDPCPPGYTLAERLATVRKVQGLSQRKLAEKLGVDPGTLQSWEAGRHQPTGKSLDIIGRILQSRGG